MGSPRQLKGCRAKLDRAADHLNALNEEVLDFLKTNPYGVFGEFDPKGSKYIFRVNVAHEPPPRLGAIFGDLIHNLRSALDHLVYELVLLNGHSPNRSRTCFPIYDSNPPGGFACATTESLRGVGDAERALIEELQPYNRAELEGRALGLIRRYSNQDKHRTLVGFQAAIAYPGAELPIRFTPNEDARIVGHFILTTGLLGRDAQLVRVPVEALGPNPEVEMEGNLPLDVAFGEDPALRAGAIPATAGEVARVITQFEPFFQRLF